MDGSGGYLLSGTTVERSAKSDSLVTKALKKLEERAEIPVTVAPCSEENNSASQKDETDEPPAKKVKEA